MEKKKMKIWKKILLLILVLFLLFAIFVVRKYIIVTNLLSASKKYVDKTNYIVEVYSLQSNAVNLSKTYYKDGDYLSTVRTYNNNTLDERGLTVYNKDNKTIGIIQSGEEKIALLQGNVLGASTMVSTFNIFNDTTFKLQLSLMSKITTDVCNNKECYLIELSKDYKIWVEKETGIILREINIDYITNRNYIFDTVTNENIKEPDISDCKIQQ